MVRSGGPTWCFRQNQRSQCSYHRLAVSEGEELASDLGKLESVPLRSVWSGEATHFTPWLAEPHNLKLLGDAIDFDLETIETEKRIGDFRLDILAKHRDSVEAVIIENQFGRTDHSHLGQLLTYAAGSRSEGSGSITIIWIAEAFSEPHRSALDWLNQSTDPGIRFFGVEIELWKIGASLPAPNFKLVSKPNDWQKAVAQQSQAVVDWKARYLRFWTGFVSFSTERKSILRLRTPSTQYWMDSAIGRARFTVTFTAAVRDGYAGCELYMSGSRAKEAFRILSQDREQIQEDLGFEVEFEELPSRVASRIVIRSKFDLKQESRWDEVFVWMLQKGESFSRVFTPLVRDLNLLDTADEPESAQSDEGDESR
jgi:hypothetical protein